jgi:alpha-tubulin suppressor-like RCC1 family protein
MLPFPIISQTPSYQLASPIQMAATDGEVNMLSSTGKVWGRGNWSSMYFGAPSTEWEVIASNVSELYSSTGNATPSLLMKKNDGTWIIRGRNPFINNWSVVDYNCTTQMNALIAISPISRIHNSGQTFGVLLQNGNLYFVGSNQNGKYGIGSTTTRYATFQLVAQNVRDFGLRESWANYISTTNVMYGAGASWNQTIGTSPTGSVLTWTQQSINVDKFWMRESTSGGSVIRLLNGTYQAKGVSHLSGALSADTTTYTTFTNARPYSEFFLAENYSFALGTNGVLYSCGVSGLGATSQGSTASGVVTTLFTPVQSTIPVTSNVSFTWVGARFTTCISLMDGTVLICGRGSALYNLIPGVTTDQGSFIKLTLPVEQ